MKERSASYIPTQLGTIMHLSVRLDFLEWFQKFLENNPQIDIAAENHTLQGWKEFFNQHDYSITKQTLRRLGSGDEEVKKITSRRKYIITKRYEDGTTEKSRGYDIQFGETPFKENRKDCGLFGYRGYYNIIPFLVFETNKDTSARRRAEYLEGRDEENEGYSDMYFKINPDFVKNLESTIENYTSRIAECKANLRKAKIQSIEREIEGLQEYLNLLLSGEEIKRVN